MTQVLKSKRIKIYDEDRKKVKCHIFNPIELSHMNAIWTRVEDILSKKKIKGRYITVGKSQCCSKHQSQTSFIVEVSPEIEVQTIIDIKKSLDGIVDFVTITSRSDRGQQFLDLIFIQNI